MVELVDTADSKSASREWGQVPLRVPKIPLFKEDK